MDKELLAAALALDEDLFVPPHLRPGVMLTSSAASTAPARTVAPRTPEPLPYEAVPLLYPYHDEGGGG